MWLRRRNRRLLEPDPGAVHAAREAEEQATRELAIVRARAAEVDRVSCALRNTLERNHFGESIEIAFRRRTAT